MDYKYKNGLAGIDEVQRYFIDSRKTTYSNRKDVDFKKCRDKYSLMRLKQKEIVEKLKS